MTTIRTTDLAIHRADLDDTTAVAATVAAAFFDDPVTRWLVPDPVRRRAVVQPLFEHFIRPFVALGATYLGAEGVGAAVWSPPGAELMSPTELEAWGEELPSSLAPTSCGSLSSRRPSPSTIPRSRCTTCSSLPRCQLHRARGSDRCSSRDMLARADREQHARLPRGDHAPEPRAVRAARLRHPRRVHPARRPAVVADVARSPMTSHHIRPTHPRCPRGHLVQTSAPPGAAAHHDSPAHSE